MKKRIFFGLAAVIAIIVANVGAFWGFKTHDRISFIMVFGGLIALLVITALAMLTLKPKHLPQYFCQKCNKVRIIFREETELPRHPIWRCNKCNSRISLGTSMRILLEQ